MVYKYITEIFFKKYYSVFRKKIEYNLWYAACSVFSCVYYHNIINSISYILLNLSDGTKYFM